MMLFEYALFAQCEDFYDVTPQVREAFAKSGVVSSIAVICCPRNFSQPYRRASLTCWTTSGLISGGRSNILPEINPEVALTASKGLLVRGKHLPSHKRLPRKKIMENRKILWSDIDFTQITLQ